MSAPFAFYLCEGFQLLDLAGPTAALTAANRLLGAEYYRIELISKDGDTVLGDAGLSLTARLAGASPAETVVVVGGMIEPMLEPDNIAGIQRASAEASSIASICTGAFLLAAAGYLDGKRATTHWQFAQRLQDRYPRVTVDADRIFINDGAIWTSAGMTAGIDLMLARIEVDHGAEMAKSVSRELVVYHRRPGGQSQYAAISQMEPRTDRIRKALTYARDHLSEPLSIDRLAEAACLSVRQFTRLFRKETGETPARAIERLRCEAARIRLRDGNEPVGTVALLVGFADAERMRCAFLRSFGHPPQTQRRLDQPLSVNTSGLSCWPPG
ncbi:AraC family transcriptional regulator /AraC family transcriptional regulator with amidase-like domain [Sphingomonas faeni]|uniref:AraC family transcriptional regulator /AraC family transcriptional regulator with amidase-like domain n=1 Tax=Sphingomonas faeni TaxID=185950 RepID=A0A2T5U8X5_9SPHN|nr:GlxA family transcriptional regulator [Sphingomonas faeni]PTW47924.1 AraC family transcriptional regulator /AraC family transcriptional regulator with amidase-like domain [Sphingomonas faeni]